MPKLPNVRRLRHAVRTIALVIALLLVAPCTANVIGKFANGIADDFLSSLYLATKAPVLLAPAMNSNMLAHDAVQRNLRTLAERGVQFVDPGEGYLACGWIGKGRLAEPADVVEAAARVLAPPSSALRGTHFVVTAGPTYEDIDPVRYVGNRSSGRMGFAIASEARRRGAHVTLVVGPTTVEPPATDATIRVRSAAEMHFAVMDAASRADVVVMAAAVADYAPAHSNGEKIAKTDGPLTLTLERTRDILADLARLPSRAAGAPVLVGFAAETENLKVYAQEKRHQKRIPLLAANLAQEAFGRDDNALTLFDDAGEHVLARAPKIVLARQLVAHIARMLPKTR